MKRINIYLTEEQEKFLLSIKEESGASLAEIVRRLINKEQETRNAGNLQFRPVNKSEEN